MFARILSADIRKKEMPLFAGLLVAVIF